MQAAARVTHEELARWLAPRCEPDLAHVMTSVLEAFDANVQDTIRTLGFRNANGAQGHNRKLRMELVRGFETFASAQAMVESQAAHERFDATHSRLRALIDEFLAKSAGGSLAWAALSVLQDQLRMAQVDAREKLFRQELKEGKELPHLCEPGRTPEALVSILVLEKRAVPEWLRVLGGGQAK